MGPRKVDATDRVLNIANRIVKRESHLELLKIVAGNRNLIESRILSSIQPSVGIRFHHKDIEQKKFHILKDARVAIINNCSVVEATRDINRGQLNLNRILRRTSDRQKVEDLIKISQGKTKHETLKRLQSKISFHLDKQTATTPAQHQNVCQKRNERRVKHKKRSALARKRYRQRKRLQKQQWIRERVNDISTSIVRNFTDIEVPNTAYLYLARGLNFVQSKKANKEDLEFDTKEFIRKLEWRAHFYQADGENISDHDNIHADMRIPSRRSAPEQNSPLLDAIKTKLLGFLTTFQPTAPSSNLTPAEQRGKRWLVNMVKERKIFVTEADKGGAVLLLNFDTALQAVRKEMNNVEKFTGLDTPVQEKMKQTEREVRVLVNNMEVAGKITAHDKTLITGITENGGMKQSPVFKSVVPYPYPLFKIHKLSESQISEKVIPPFRLVHSTRQGPLYRLEKWCSPYLTDISRDYCKDEFLLDTPNLLDFVEDLNKTWPSGDKSLLFTLDVVALYPSISVDMALKAMENAFSRDTIYDTATKSVLTCFCEFILKQSFVVFEEVAYIGKRGIPTGNCISRQVADMAMHWLLFKELRLNTWAYWKLISLWKRFIDDILGRWRGTERQFHLFIAELNRLAHPFGIQFADAQIGPRVNFLDLQLYLDTEGQIQYSLFRKKTDARQYLNTSSFHPPQVFESVAFSQMLRVIKRNSNDENCVSDLDELKTDLSRCGHHPQRLEELEPKAVERAISNDLPVAVQPGNGRVVTNNNNLVFTTKYFKEVKELKKLVHSMKDDIAALVGEGRIIFALKKHESVKDNVVKNRVLSRGSTRKNGSMKKHPETQACGGKGCKTCPLVFGPGDKVMVNGKEVILDSKLSCKDKNVIYIAQCIVCAGRVGGECAYFGQTSTEVRTRFNGHRSSFKIDDMNTYTKSALSQHSFDTHPDKFGLEFFKVGFVKQCKAENLDREEHRLISLFRTNLFGINRIKVIR